MKGVYKNSINIEYMNNICMKVYELSNRRKRSKRAIVRERL